MKKWLLRLGLGFLVVLLLLYSFLMVRSKIPATVNDGELQLVRANIPKGSNAFDVFQEAGGHIWWPENQSENIYDLARNTNWDDNLASTVLASNREALAGWDAAIKQPDFQVPEVFDPSASPTYLSNWKKLALLAEVRGNFLFHNGQDKEAFDQVLKIVQLGRRMQNANGVLIDYLVGAAVNNIGLSQIQHWAGKSHLNANQLEDFIHQLELKPEAESAAYANTIKGEYQFQTMMVEMTCTGKMTNTQGGGYFPSVMPLCPVFNLSQTKTLFAQGALKLVKAASHHYNEVNVGDMEVRPNLVSLYLSGNVVGQVLYYMAIPAVATSLAQKSRCDVQLQTTRTILALRAYQLTHGNLPPDLNTLVPEFLDAVPIDDFDGQPLRYSAEKKIVYSVGKNLKDDGGDDRNSSNDQSARHLDFAYKFDF